MQFSKRSRSLILSDSISRTVYEAFCVVLFTFFLLYYVLNVFCLTALWPLFLCMLFSCLLLPCSFVSYSRLIVFIVAFCFSNSLSLLAFSRSVIMFWLFSFPEATFCFCCLYSLIIIFISSLRLLASSPFLVISSSLRCSWELILITTFFNSSFSFAFRFFSIYFYIFSIWSSFSDASLILIVLKF